MTVAILKLGGRQNGPETWREGLYDCLRSSPNIHPIQVDSARLGSLLRPGWLRGADVVHNYHIAPAAIVYSLLGRLLGKRVVFTMHGDFLREQASKRGLKRLLWRPLNLLALATAHTITFPSAYLRDAITSRLPWVGPKSRVIPNGIAAAGSAAKPSPVASPGQSAASARPQVAGRSGQTWRLISVTSFNHAGKYEGLIPLIKAATALTKAGERLSLTIVGAGRALEIYRRLYATPHIHFAGYSDDVAGFIARSDALVHSTNLDNAPYVILEAMVAGKPVLATPTGGIPEMLPPQGLVKPTAESWEQHLGSLMHQAGYAEKLRRQCIAKLKQFEWPTVGAQFIQVYQRH